MNALRLLGTGLLKKDKKTKGRVNSKEKNLKSKKNTQRVNRAASVELFLRETLGNRLIQVEKNF